MDFAFRLRLRVACGMDLGISGTAAVLCLPPQPAHVSVLQPEATVSRSSGQNPGTERRHRARSDVCLQAHSEPAHWAVCGPRQAAGGWDLSGRGAPPDGSLSVPGTCRGEFWKVGGLSNHRGKPGGKDGSVVRGHECPVRARAQGRSRSPADLLSAGTEFHLLHWVLSPCWWEVLPPRVASLLSHSRKRSRTRGLRGGLSGKFSAGLPQFAVGAQGRTRSARGQQSQGRVDALQKVAAQLRTSESAHRSS